MKRSRTMAFGNKPFRRRVRAKRPSSALYLRRLAASRGHTEIKYLDRAYAGQVETGSVWNNAGVDPATTLCLNAPPEGTDLTERVGRKIWMRNLRIKGILALSAYDGTVEIGDQLVRLVVFLDKQTNKLSTATPNMVFDTSTGTTAPPILFPTSTANFGRFSVLYDKTFRLNQNSYASEDGTADKMGGAIIRPFKIKINLKNLEVNFATTTGIGQISDIIDNSIRVAAMCYKANSDTRKPTLTYHSRLSFTDM